MIVQVYWARLIILFRKSNIFLQIPIIKGSSEVSPIGWDITFESLVLHWLCSYSYGVRAHVNMLSFHFKQNGILILLSYYLLHGHESSLSIPVFYRRWYLMCYAKLCFLVMLTSFIFANRFILIALSLLLHSLIWSFPFRDFTCHSNFQAAYFVGIVELSGIVKSIIFPIEIKTLVCVNWSTSY